MSTNRWIGVDLDGTLAQSTQDKSAIGAPVPSMIARVKRWLAKGYRVKILTARANDQASILPIQSWLQLHLGQILEITSNKDAGMIALFDDRAVRVVKDVGQLRFSASWPLPYRGPIPTVPASKKHYTGVDIGWIHPHGHAYDLEDQMKDMPKDSSYSHAELAEHITGGKAGHGDLFKHNWVRVEHNNHSEGLAISALRLTRHNRPVVDSLVREHIGERPVFVDVGNRSYDLKRGGDLYDMHLKESSRRHEFASDTDPAYSIASQGAEVASTRAVRLQAQHGKGSVQADKAHKLAANAHLDAAQIHSFQRQWQRDVGNETQSKYHEKIEKGHKEQAAWHKGMIAAPHSFAADTDSAAQIATASANRMSARTGGDWMANTATKEERDKRHEQAAMAHLRAAKVHGETAERHRLASAFDKALDHKYIMQHHWGMANMHKRNMTRPFVQSEFAADAFGRYSPNGQRNWTYKPGAFRKVKVPPIQAHPAPAPAKPSAVPTAASGGAASQGGSPTSIAATTKPAEQLAKLKDIFDKYAPVKGKPSPSTTPAPATSGTGIPVHLLAASKAAFQQSAKISPLLPPSARIAKHRDVTMRHYDVMRRANRAGVPDLEAKHKQAWQSGKAVLSRLHKVHGTQTFTAHKRGAFPDLDAVATGRKSIVTHKLYKSVNRLMAAYDLRRRRGDKGAYARAHYDTAWNRYLQEHEGSDEIPHTPRGRSSNLHPPEEGNYRDLGFSSAEGGYGAWIDGRSGTTYPVYGPMHHRVVSQRTWKIEPEVAISRGHIRVIHADPDTSAPLALEGRADSLQRHASKVHAMIGAAVYKHRVGAYVRVHDGPNVKDFDITGSSSHEQLKTFLTRDHEFSSDNTPSVKMWITNAGKERILAPRDRHENYAVRHFRIPDETKPPYSNPEHEAIRRGHIRVASTEPAAIEGTLAALNKHADNVRRIIAGSLKQNQSAHVTVHSTHRIGSDGPHRAYYIKDHQQHAKFWEKIGKLKMYDLLPGHAPLTGEMFSTAAATLSSAATHLTQRAMSVTDHKAAIVAHRRAAERFVKRVNVNNHDLESAQLAGYHGRMRATHERLLREALKGEQEFAS